MYVIDRIDENIAVITGGDESFEISATALYDGAKEGDVVNINYDNGAITEIVFDENETKARTEKMQTRLNNLFGN